MNFFRQIPLLLEVTRSRNIARRYFVVNGFDGALTMLGIIVGFYQAENAAIPVVLAACLGAAIALGVSGLSSAYISEAAERRLELQTLESAMITDLGDTAHGRAARLVPFFIAMVNGLAPLLISLVIIAPLWWPALFAALSINVLEASIAIALVVIFLMGVFLGKVSGHFWLFSGVRTLLVALVTAAIIMFFSPGG